MNVALQGGLCNQLFQYSFGRSVSLAKNEECSFDNSSLGINKHRQYMLDPFGFEIKIDNTSNAPVYCEKSFAYDPEVYSSPKGIRYSGYWQTEKYFNAETLRRDIKFRSPIETHVRYDAEKIAQNLNSCFVHVRRGDYLNEPHASFHGNLGNDYYNSAIDVIKSNKDDVKFFVFSDDPKWCRDNLFDYSTTVTIIDTDEYTSLWLMSLCRHAIIANSSFSWWGAWAGDEQKNRIVIGPKHWFKNTPAPDVLPSRWLAI